MKKRVMLRLSGRVQGVFFRVMAQEKALSFGLTGAARNEHDGTVTLDIEGAPEDIDSMIVWCREGSGHASVTDVLIEEVDPVGYTGFSIQ